MSVAVPEELNVAAREGFCNAGAVANYQSCGVLACGAAEILEALFTEYNCVALFALFAPFEHFSYTREVKAGGTA